jgi:transcriptional regulator with XRE-family HTH domain
MSFGETLKEALARAGMTQKELVDMLKKKDTNIAYTTLNYYVTNDIVPKEKILEAIIEALKDRGVDVYAGSFENLGENLGEKKRSILDRIRDCILDMNITKKEVIENTGVKLSDFDIEDSKIPDLSKLDLYKIASYLKINPNYFLNRYEQREPKALPISNELSIIPVVAHAPYGFNIGIHDAAIGEITVPCEYLGYEDGRAVYALKVINLKDLESVTLKIEPADYLLFKEGDDFGHKDLIILRERKTSRVFIRRFHGKKIDEFNLYPRVKTNNNKRSASTIEDITLESVDFDQKGTSLLRIEKPEEAPYVYVGRVVSIIRLYRQ